MPRWRTLSLQASVWLHEQHARKFQVPTDPWLIQSHDGNDKYSLSSLNDSVSRVTSRRHLKVLDDYSSTMVRNVVVASSAFSERQSFIPTVVSDTPGAVYDSLSSVKDKESNITEIT